VEKGLCWNWAKDGGILKVADRGRYHMNETLRIFGGPGDHIFGAIKLYAVEICGTIVFVVFVVVESIRAIRHLIGGIRNG
jgi:hypothetical protein